MDLIDSKIRIVSPTYDILCEAIDSIVKNEQEFPKSSESKNGYH
jgi:hypothetical protein